MYFIFQRNVRGPSATPPKEKKLTADETLLQKVSKSDKGILEKEAFVLVQFDLIVEGQLRRHKCHYCKSYFKNSILTLQGHLRDKCPEFAKR